MRKIYLKLREQKGITLIELLVSIMIFSVIMVSVAMFNVRNTRVAITSERNAQRTLLQEEVIEKFKGRLRSSPIPGASFDSIWVFGTIGDILSADTNDDLGIVARLELDQFLPDSGGSGTMSQIGIFLGVRVISSDPDLNINDTTMIYVSRHD